MWGTNTEVLTEALEVRTAEGFGEDVGSVVCGMDTEDLEFIRLYELTGGVVFDSKVSNFRVPALVFGQLLRGFVVAV